MIGVIVISWIVFCQPSLFDQIEPTTRVLFNGEYGGCQGNFVYRATDDKTKALLVYFDSERLKISRKRKMYQIGSTPGLEVLIEDYGRYKHNEYCSDFIPYPQKPRRIYAVNGTVVLFISKRTERRTFVTVRMKNISVPTFGGTSYYVESAEMKNVHTNWIP
jgi:hypothetical protein